jgi:predicted GNAT family N-acyltransferase
MSVSVVEDLPPSRADELTALYRDYAWWDDRDRESVCRALEDTDVAVALETESGELVAAARVLTDYTYYATVFDVVVAADRRGDGVGARLMDAITDHPDLQDLPGLSLLCREGLTEFYEQAGFEVFDDPVDHPDGNPEPLVRMVYRHDDQEA